MLETCLKGISTELQTDCNFQQNFLSFTLSLNYDNSGCKQKGLLSHSRDDKVREERSCTLLYRHQFPDGVVLLLFLLLFFILLLPY